MSGHEVGPAEGEVRRFPGTDVVGSVACSIPVEGQTEPGVSITLGIAPAGGVDIADVAAATEGVDLSASQGIGYVEDHVADDQGQDGATGRLLVAGTGPTKAPPRSLVVELRTPSVGRDHVADVAALLQQTVEVLGLEPLQEVPPATATAGPS